AYTTHRRGVGTLVQRGKCGSYCGTTRLVVNQKCLQSRLEFEQVQRPATYAKVFTQNLSGVTFPRTVLHSVKNSFGNVASVSPWFPIPGQSHTFRWRCHLQCSACSSGCRSDRACREK